jgi:hypothetical protein
MVSSSQEHDKKFLNFLALSPEFFAQWKSSLKETLQANAELAYEQLIRGRSAADLITVTGLMGCEEAHLYNTGLIGCKGELVDAALSCGSQLVTQRPPARQT